MKRKSRTALRMLLILPAILLIPYMAGADDTGKEDQNMDYRSLTPEEERIMIQCGTERPFSGEYVNHHEDGTYSCRRCDAPLFASDAKFDSGSGWPSFDEALPGAVKEIPDADGRRTEIVCARCGAHLGHVFKGEGFTKKNTRHCVNSISLDFKSSFSDTATAYFAGGCFWGVEFWFEQIPGVFSAESGYMGGRLEKPSYEQVSAGRSGHAEAVKVSYDPGRVTYRDLAKRFFEIHDPTQVNRQGPDIGEQYRSVVFYATDEQRAIAKDLIVTLEKRGYDVATELQPAGTFWPAESYHQDYYEHKGSEPYCHVPVDRFGE